MTKEKKKNTEEWDPEIPPLNDQLSKVSERLLGRLSELDITPRIIQQRSGLALNSVKTALQGKSCNIATLAAVAASMKWTLEQCFIGDDSESSASPTEPESTSQEESQEAPAPKDTQSVAFKAEPIVVNPEKEEDPAPSPSPASSILD